MRALKRADFGSACLLLLLSLCFFSPLLRFDKVLYSGDFLAQVFPAYAWLHQRLASGLSSFWCGGILAGHPIQDESQIGAFYPPARWIFTYFDALHGLPLFLILHVFFLALGAYALARALGLSPLPAFFSALLAAFGGPACNTWYFNDIASLTWLPWSLLGLFWIVKGRAWSGAALLGLAEGLGLSGGHPGLWILGQLLVMACLGAWAWRFRPRAGTVAIGLGLAAALAFCISWGQLEAGLRYKRASLRSTAFSYDEGAANSLSPASLLQAPLPYLFGNPADNSFLGHSWKGGSWLPQGMVVYVGLMALLFAALGFLRRRLDCLPFAAMALFFILYSLGPLTPLHRLLQPLPPFNALRAPMKAATHLGLLLSLCAGFGLQAGLESHRDLGRVAKQALFVSGLWLLSALALWLGATRLNALGELLIKHRDSSGTLSLYGSDYYRFKFQAFVTGLRGHLALLGLFAGLSGLGLGLAASKPSLRRLGLGLMLACVFVEFRAMVWQYYPLAQPELYTQVSPGLALIKGREAHSTEPFRILGSGYRDLLPLAYPHGLRGQDAASEALLQSTYGSSYSLLFGVDNLRGYTPAGLKRDMVLIDALGDSAPEIDMQQHVALLLHWRPLMDKAGVKYLLCSRSLKARGLEELKPGPVHVILNHQALPLARFATKLAVAPNAAAALEMARAQPGSEILEAPSVAGPAGKADKVRWISKDDTRWRLALHSVGRRVLVLASSYYPEGWTASLDGKSVPIFPVDGMFSGILVGPGSHQVDYVAADFHEARNRLLQAFGFVACLGLLGLGFFRSQENA